MVSSEALAALATVAALAAAAAVWRAWRARGSLPESLPGYVPAEERHLAKGGEHGSAVGLGWVENGILRVSRDRGGALKVLSVLRLVGPAIDRTAFGKAVAALQKRHPVLRSRLRTSPGGDKYWLEVDEEATVPLFWRTRELGEGTYAKIWEEESKLAPPVGDVPLKLIVLEDEDSERGVREVMFIMDHSFCDGLSVTNVLRELTVLMAAYHKGGDVDSEALIGPPLPWQPPMEIKVSESFPSGKLVLGIKTALYVMRHMLLEKKMVNFPVAQPEVPASEIFKKCVSRPYTQTMPAAEATKLAAACKAAGVTVGAALGAATMFAARDLAAAEPGFEGELDKHLAVPLAMDLRRRYSEPLSQKLLGYNISSNKAYRVTFRDLVHEEASRENLIAHARRAGAHYAKFDYAGLLLGSVIGGFFEQPPTYENLSTVAISNWGRLVMDRSYGPWEVDNVFGFLNTPHFRMPTLICSSLHGALTMTLVNTEPVCTPESARRFQARLLKNLQIIAATDADTATDAN